MAVLLLLQVLAVGLVAARLSGHLTRPDGPASDRWLAGLVLALAQVVSIAQVLAASHLFSRGFLLVSHVLLAALVLWRVPPAPAARTSALALPGALSAGLATVVGALALVFGLDGRSLEVDTTQYHAPNAGFWATSHHLWDPPFAAPGYLWAGYPSNLELSAAWCIVPLGSDLGIYALNVVWGALLVLGIAVLARELGSTLWIGGLAGAALVLTPLVFTTQVHSLATDTAASAGIVAALALVLVARRAQPPPVWWLLPGLALGLSLGSKYTALVPAAAVVVAVAALAPSGSTATQRLRAAASVGAVASTLLVLWLVRNWVQLGNPLYPLHVSLGDTVVFTGADTVLDRYEAPMLHHLLHLSGDPLRTWWSTARLLIGPALILLGVGIAGGLLVSRRRVGASVQRVVAVVAVGCFLGYVATPYTGGGVEGAEFLIGSQLRYSLAAQALAVALFAAVVPRAIAVPGLLAIAAWGAWELLDGAGFRPDLDLTVRIAAVTLVAAALAGMVWAAVAIGGERWRGSTRGRAVVAVPAILLVVLCVAWARRAPDDVPPETEAVLAAARERGPILVVSAQDVRALLGDGFEGRLVKVSDGGVADERVLLDGDELEARVEAARPALVVVGAPEILLPPGWSPPPSWDEVGRLGPDTYYTVPQ